MRRRLRGLLAACLTVCLMGGVAVSAAPSGSYSYWYGVSGDNKSVYSRALYTATRFVGADSAGTDDFTSISYITAKDDSIYVLDSASRIVVLDREFRAVREIGAIGGNDSYDEATSIYIDADDTIYICDSGRSRILHVTPTGELIETVTLPESPLIPDDFQFLPTRVAKDSYGYLYVLSEGSYYGALLYSPEGEFVGFYGANTVNSGIAGVLQNIKNRLLPNNEKLSKTVRRLPYCFVDIDIDSEGFVYTCNGYTSGNDRTGKIRKLSPGVGTDILNSDDVVFTDYEIPLYTIEGTAFDRHNLSDISVDSDGLIYGLETVYGKVFVYDSECRILGVIGGGMGEGVTLGSFTRVSGLALLDDGAQLLVSDSDTNLITVFDITDYGREIKRLSALTADGDYEAAKPGWEQVLAADKNFQPAYSGLALAALGEEDYRAALSYARLGYDRDSYAIAFEYLRRDFLDRHFLPLFILLVVAVVGIIALIAVSMRRRIAVVRSRELRLMLSAPLHPADCFAEVKEKGAGSIPLCLLITAVFYVVTVLQTLAGGFLFTVYDPASFNSLWVFVSSVGLVALWIVANWMVCTLLGGKGRLREILVVTCYSLLPIIVERLLRLVLTNILLPSEASFLSILDTVALLYFGLMMIIGLVKIHDFGFGRLVGTSLLSAAGIAAIVFLLITVAILIQQFWGFIVTVGSELLTL